MNISEGKKYQLNRSYLFQEIELKKGTWIGVESIDSSLIYCVVYLPSDEILMEINAKRLLELIDFSSEQEDYYSCEECHCQLDYLPNAGWGVGYVCANCAKHLRGEYEL